MFPRPGTISSRLRAKAAALLEPLVGRFFDGHLRAAMLGSLASLTTKALAAVGSFALTALVARRFHAAGSGDFALGTTLLTICSYVSLCGLDYASTRAVAVLRAGDRYDAIRGWSRAGFRILLPLGLVISAAAWFAGRRYAGHLSPGPEFPMVLSALCFAVLPITATRFIAGMLRGMRRFAAADMFESVAIPVGLSLAILLFGMNSIADVANLYAGAAVVTALGALWVWRANLGDRGRPAEPTPLPGVLKRSLPLAGTVMATLAGPWILTLSLAGLATPADIGVFRVTLQFAVLLGFILQAVETGLSPQMAALHSQGRLGDLARTAKKMTLALGVAGGVPALILLVFAKEFLGLLGPEFVSGVDAMRLMILAQVINLATGPVGSYMVMTGLERWSMWNAITGTIIVLVVSATCIPLLGILGAAMAFSAAVIFRNLAATVIVWRRHRVFLPLGLSPASGPDGIQT